MRPVQNGKQQQPQIKNSKHPREAENGKQQACRQNELLGNERTTTPKSNVPDQPARRTDLPVKQRAQQQQRRRCTASRCQRPHCAGSARRNVPIKVAGVRLPSGSAVAARQLSHSSKPARFRMKSIMPMKVT